MSCRTLDTALEHLGAPQEVLVQASDSGIEFRAHHFGPALGGKAAFREDLAREYSAADLAGCGPSACGADTPTADWCATTMLPRVRATLAADKAHVEASVSIRADDLERICVSETAPGVGTDEDGRPVASFVTTLSELRAMLDLCRSPAVDIGHLSFYFDSEDGAPILVTSERELHRRGSAVACEGQILPVAKPSQSHISILVLSLQATTIWASLWTR